MHEASDKSLAFSEIILTISKLLATYEEGYTFDFKKTSWNETYQLFIIDDSYRLFKLELREEKVLHLAKKGPKVLEKYLLDQLKKQGFPLVTDWFQQTTLG